jgi:hypothetical protein
MRTQAKNIARPTSFESIDTSLFEVKSDLSIGLEKLNRFKRLEPDLLSVHGVEPTGAPDVLIRLSTTERS